MLFGGQVLHSHYKCWPRAPNLDLVRNTQTRLPSLWYLCRVTSWRNRKWSPCRRMHLSSNDLCYKV